MKKVLCIATILLLYCIICQNIYKINTTKINTSTYEKKVLISKEQIGYLKINKINLKQPIYPITSKKNNIEENIAILKESIMPTEKNSIVFIAAHSGTGSIAFFEKLNKLEINDIIDLNYKNKIYNYQVTNIWEENKSGYIHVNKSKKNQLILTTCSPTNNKKQLVINCTSFN